MPYPAAVACGRRIETALVIAESMGSIEPCIERLVCAFSPILSYFYCLCHISCYVTLQVM